MGLINKLPINDRPREKARIYGIESLSNAELIALLLCTGNRKDDALQLAQKIILNVGSLSNLCHYTIEQLKEFEGIKEVKAIRIKAALELHQRIEKETKQAKTKISNIIEAANYFKAFYFNKLQENLLILMLDNSNNIIAIKNIAIGSTNSVIFSINSIVTISVKMNANRIIIAHNHPSNDVHPSKEDIQQTEQLNIVCSVIGIMFVDHLIIGENNFYSLKNNKTFDYEIS